MGRFFVPVVIKMCNLDLYQITLTNKRKTQGEPILYSPGPAKGKYEAQTNLSTDGKWSDTLLCNFTMILASPDITQHEGMHTNALIAQWPKMHVEA